MFILSYQCKSEKLKKNQAIKNCYETIIKVLSIEKVNIIGVKHSFDKKNLN